MLAAYAQAAPSDTLQLWIGIFGIPAPAQPAVAIDAPNPDIAVIGPLRPIRDGMTDVHGNDLNHRTIVRITGLAPGQPYRLVVSLAGEKPVPLDLRTLPQQLPQKLDGWFNILLCSCYSQPEDAAGRLGKVVQNKMARPDLTLMLGDQIYGDLPLTEDLPGDPVGIARKLGTKYLRNWASRDLESGGLAAVLARAPVLCVADDHEYWNNYPFSQAQLPLTYTEDGRQAWARAARELYEDYQLATAAGSAQRLTIGALEILSVDMRSDRDDSYQTLMNPATALALKGWGDALKASRALGKPCFGLLSSGQALFVKPKPYAMRKITDAEMGNYQQFNDLVVPLLEELAEAGIPVLYVTGDVHWGRISQATDVRNDQPMIFEVICSPSRLIRSPGDSLKELKAGAAGLFGQRPSWPRHSEAEPVPDKLGDSTRFQLRCNLKTQQGYGRQGDQVAMLSLCNAGGGIDFKVTYHAVADDGAPDSPHVSRNYQMRNL